MLDKIFDKYYLSSVDREVLIKIIEPIYEHQEFQKRCQSEFAHHGNITLGEHILEDTVISYLFAKKKNLNIYLVVVISMFHDLYTIPWQNNIDNSRVKYFTNKHGFRHPIEAVINAYNWYPNYFKDLNDAKIIIDGIIHHMFPFPVRRFEKDKMELKNNELVKNIPAEIINIIKDSTSRGKIGKLSFSKSKFIEGRIMAKADKYVSRYQIKNISSLLSLLTGHNKSLKK